MTMPSAFQNYPEPPAPPNFLYKYLVSERVDDVLKKGMVRFKHLINTDDTFEVRSTFKHFAGPRFQSILMEKAFNKIDDDFINNAIQRLMRDRGISGFSPELLRNLLEQQHGQSLVSALQKQMEFLIPLAIQGVNSHRTPEDWLNKMGGEILCFSLSERADISPMWSHYAGGHTGFVIRFNSHHDWFNRKGDNNQSRLQKVTYFDGQINEPLDDPQAAFISKTLDWEYQREWRLNCGINDIDEIIAVPDDPIHLIAFPADAVDGIILGEKASQDTVDKIRVTLENRYPHAGIFRAVANRKTHTFDLMPL